MNKVCFKYKGEAYILQAPSVWNEVSVEQLLQWMAVMYSKFTDEQKLELAIPVFYGIKRDMFKAIKLHQRLQIAPTLCRLIEKNTLNVWVIGHFKTLFNRYYGPADKLSNLTAHEFFNVCEPLFWKFKQTEDLDALDALVAALYRPKRKGLVDDDIREDLTDAGIAKRQQKFKRIKLPVKLAIAFNYEGCRNFITATYPKAFEAKQGQSKKRGDVTLALAGGPLGDHQQTKRTNLYTFLLHLENLIEQEEQLKKK